MNEPAHTHEKAHALRMHYIYICNTMCRWSAHEAHGMCVEGCDVGGYDAACLVVLFFAVVRAREWKLRPGCVR